MALKSLYKITIQTPKQSTELLLTQDAVTVGRSSDNEVCVESVGISRKHLKIESRSGDLMVTDLNSTNGTIYQGVKLKPNTPVPYSGGVIHLGPVSDGNRLELIQETAVKEGTRTLTQAKVLEASARASAREKERLHELSRINSTPVEPEPAKVVVKEPSRVVEAPREVSRVAEAPKEASRIAEAPVRSEPRRAHTQNSAIYTPPPVENIVSRPVEEHILEGMREEIRRLRQDQEETENARRDAEAHRNELEDESRRLRKDVDEFEARLSAMRERTREEEDRLKRRLAEIAEKLKTEETLFQNRRDELSHERDALHKLERETIIARDELEKEKLTLAEELERIKYRGEREIREAAEAHAEEIAGFKAQYVEEKEKLAIEHRIERRRLEDDQELLTERLKDEHEKLKKKLTQEAASEKKRCEDEAIAARRKSEDEIAAAKKKFDEEFLAIKRKAESESVAAQERYAEEAATERRRIAEDLEADRKRLMKEKREYAEEVGAEKKKQTEDLMALKLRLKEEREKCEADAAAEIKRVNGESAAEVSRMKGETAAEVQRMTAETADEIKRLTDELSDHVSRTTRERKEIDDLHHAFVSKIREDESKLQKEFDAVDKKHKIQLETLIAEIALKEAQEQKIIEQRKTERLVAERELAESRQQLDTAKKELAALHKNVVSVQEQLVRREEEHQSLQESVAKSQKEQEMLQAEIQKCTETAAGKRSEIAKLEAALIEQQKKNMADLDNAVREAQETKRAIIAQGQSDADLHRRRSEDALAKELGAIRGEAKSRLEADIADWGKELARRKARETEDMNLWFAEEKRKIQDRLSGDLDNFVDTVTSAAMAQMNQNSQFSSLIHEFHSKFSNELRHALTQPQEQFVAQFNPDRKKSTQTFWVKSAVAAVLIAVAGVLVKVGPAYIREATEQRRVSHDDGATGEWVKKIQLEREQRLALKLEVRTDFQFSYSQNVLYNEGYLEMKLDQSLQNLWVKELNQLMTGEKAMGMDDEALVDYIRIEHALFVDLAEKKGRMNAINKDDFVQQMDALSKQAVQDLVQVLKTKMIPSSDRARQTSPEQKWRAIRELEKKFYTEHVLQSERRPAAK
jgi:pSer/pThr/pTyr-binding forkhead associated (FHA) protein